jgi:hypothetical protein
MTHNNYHMQPKPLPEHAFRLLNRYSFSLPYYTLLYPTITEPVCMWHLCKQIVTIILLLPTHVSTVL